MPTSETSAPTIGSPVVTEVTLPSMVPVCAARRVTAGRHSNDAATAIRKDRTRIMIGSSLKQERCGISRSVLQEEMAPVAKRCQGSRNRGGGIRTRDLLVPNQARYRTAPHPV